MKKQEFIKGLLDAFNNDDDETLTTHQIKILTRVKETGAQIKALEDKAKSVEEEVNEKTNELNNLRNSIIQSRIRVDTFMDTLVTLADHEWTE